MMKSQMDNLSPEQKKKRAKFIQEFLDTFSERVCMAKDDNCSGGIVRSHTVSRARYLSHIAENNHVRQWKASLWADAKEEVMSLELTGLNVASTFNGYCSYHDALLFQTIDNSPFQATHSQLFAQAYRAHAREVYCKRAQILAFPDPNQMADFHGFENPASYGYSPIVETLLMSMKLGLYDAIVHYNRLHDIRNLGDYRRLCSCVIPLNGTPMISVAGGFFPNFSVTGEKIQDFTNFESTINVLHYSILPTESGGYAIFSFLDTESAGPKQFVESVLKHEKLANILILVAFLYIENIQVRPSWWEGLNEEQQKSIKIAFSCNSDFFDPRLLTGANYPNLEFTKLIAGKPFWI